MAGDDEPAVRLGLLLRHIAVSQRPIPVLPGVQEAVRRRRRSDPNRISRFSSQLIEKAFFAFVALASVGTAREFLERRAGEAKPKNLLKYLRKAGRERPAETDRR